MAPAQHTDLLADQDARPIANEEDRSQTESQDDVALLVRRLNFLIPFASFS
jgi:hypothetical protein